MSLAVLMTVPVSNAEAAMLTHGTSVDPPTADAGTVHCSGIAPLQPRCSATFSAYSSLSITVDGLFTGELVCLFRGPNNSSLIYRLEMVGGLVVTYTASGALYTGAISLGCEAKGFMGAGGSFTGVGDYDFIVSYA